MTARGDRTKAALIAATTQLVAEVGYRQATTKDIAHRAGVSEGTIYRHYPDKRALFTAAILSGQQALTDWLDGLPDRAGTAPVHDVLTETFTQLSRLRSVVLPLETALAAEPDLAPTPPPVLPADLTAAVADLGGPPHLLAHYLQREQRLGHIRPDRDPTLTAVLLLASLYGAQTTPLAGSDGLPPPVIDALVTVLLDGIRT